MVFGGDGGNALEYISQFDIDDLEDGDEDLWVDDVDEGGFDLDGKFDFASGEDGFDVVALEDGTFFLCDENNLDRNDVEAL